MESTTNRPETPVLAIVSPCYNDADTIKLSVPVFIEKINTLINDGLVAKNSYLLLVDDSTDSSVWEEIKLLTDKYSNINAIKNATNLGEQKAYLRGITEAKSCADIVVTMDDDLQDDPDILPDMISLYNDGAEIVIAYREKRESDSIFYRFCASGFYFVMRLLGSKIVPQSSQYRLMSATACEKLLQQQTKFLFLPAQVAEIDLPIKTIPYTRKERIAGHSGYNYSSLIKLAINAIKNHTVLKCFPKK